jgi:hypothetical protein
MARRRINVFSLSFLDAMTCGFGAVVLFYMIINASVGVRAGRMTSDLRGEVNRLEVEVLEGHTNLVELRNSKREVELELVAAQGMATRLIRQIEELRLELATYADSSLASKEHINQLQTDLKTLETSARRLSASVPSDELPGDRLRSFVGDGDRQYLTGLKVGGERIVILVDASASMLDETIVNIIRRRNLPTEVKRQADKWRQAVGTVDWLTTQLPRSSKFQIYTFNEQAGPVVSGTSGDWLDAGSREDLENAISALRGVAPEGGTNLHAGFTALRTLRPTPDNVILLVDGLPTQGDEPVRKRTVSGDKRMKLFRKAVRQVPAGVPVNVIMFPMEGDPMAASAFWNLAILTRGSYMSPSKDWP